MQHLALRYLVHAPALTRLLNAGALALVLLSLAQPAAAQAPDAPQRIINTVVGEVTKWGGVATVILGVSVLVYLALKIQGQALTGRAEGLGTAAAGVGLLFAGFMLMWFAPDIVDGMTALVRTNRRDTVVRRLPGT